MFGEILFPVDFSERCLRFAPQVNLIAREVGARITLLHVIELSYMWYAGFEAPVYSAMIDLNPFREAGETRLRAIRDTQFAGLEVQLAQEEGDPAGLILQYLENHGCDLVMMPTHGCGIFRRALLGSVVSKVLHDARVPIWTDKHQKAATVDPPRLPKHIVTAVDESDRSIPVMQWADRLARQFNADLSIIHAVPSTAGLPVHLSDSEVVTTLEVEARERVRILQAAAGVTGRVHVEPGSVTSVVREDAERQKADLLIIGRGHLQERLGAFRTHVYGIVEGAPCAVLSV